MSDRENRHKSVGIILMKNEVASENLLFDILVGSIIKSED